MNQIKNIHMFDKQMSKVLLILFALFMFIITPIFASTTLLKIEKKDKFVAATMAMFVPTMGHAYAGDWKRGTQIFAVEAALLGAAWGAGMSSYSNGGNLTLANLLFVGVIGTHLWAAFDAYTLAETNNISSSKEYFSCVSKKDYSDKKEPLIAAVVGFIPTLGHAYAGDWGRGTPILFLEAIALSIFAYGSSNNIGVLTSIGNNSMMGLWIYSMIDAYLTAQDHNHNLLKNMTIYTTGSDIQLAFQYSF